MGRRTNGGRVLAAALVGALVIAAVVVVLVRLGGGDDSRQALLDSRSLAASAWATMEDDPDAALLLALEAYAAVSKGPAAESYEARHALVTAYERFAPVTAVLRGHDGEVTAVAFSPDGTVLASGDAGGTVRLWSLRGQAAPRVLSRHRGPVRAIAWSPDGALVASAGDDALIRVGDAGSTHAVAELRAPGTEVETLVFAPDGRTLASAGGTVRLWDVARRAQRGPALHITAAGLAFSKDSRMVTVVNRVGRISRHDVHRPGRFVEAPYDTSYEEYVDAEVAPSGTFVALAGESGPAVWALRGRTPRPLPLEGEGSTASPWVVAMSRNRVVAAGPEGALSQWRVDDVGAVRLASIELRNGGTVALALDPRGRAIAAGGLDGTVRVARADAADVLVRTALGPEPPFTGETVVTSSDGRFRATLEVGDWGEPTRVVVRDAAGKRIGEPFTTIWTLAAPASDGRRAALVGADGRARLWDLERGVPDGPPFVGRLATPDAPLAGGLALDPDASVLAAAGFDSGFRLWDVSRRAPLGDAVPLDIGGDGERLRFDRRRNGFVWDVDGEQRVLDPLLSSSEIGRWRARVCAAVARNLTQEEWRVVLPGRSYRRTCPGLPAGR